MYLCISLNYPEKNLSICWHILPHAVQYTCVCNGMVMTRWCDHILCRNLGKKKHNRPWAQSTLFHTRSTERLHKLSSFSYLRDKSELLMQCSIVFLAEIALSDMGKQNRFCITVSVLQGRDWIEDVYDKKRERWQNILNCSTLHVLIVGHREGYFGSLHGNTGKPCILISVPDFHPVKTYTHIPLWFQQFIV